MRALRTIITCAALFLLLFGSDTPALSESGRLAFSSLQLSVKGATQDGSLTFKGDSTVNLLTRRGTIGVRTSRNIACRGTTSLALSYRAGEGAMVCEDGLTATFKFRIDSLQPIAGKGGGVASDGRQFDFSLARR